MERRLQLFSLSAFLLAVLSYDAHAVIGKNVSEALEAEHAHVCKIDVLDNKDPSIDSSCTGTLISPTQVLTAGHCFGRKFSLKTSSVIVSCGGKLGSDVKHVLLPDTARSDFWLSNMEPVRDQDYAVVTLQKAISHSAVTIASNPDQYFDSKGKLVDEAECKVLGYGKSNADVKGPLSQADLKDVKITYDREAKLIRMAPQDSTFLATSVDGGDSGGPVFCQLKNHQPELMATIVLYHYVGATMNRDLNLATPAWLHQAHALNERSGTHLD